MNFFLDMMGLTTEKLLFILVVFLAVFVVLCFVLCMINMSKIQRISSESEETPSTEELKKYLKKIKQLSENVERISAAAASQKNNEPSENAPAPVTQVVKQVSTDDNAITKFAVVHFNAFPGLTGSISFSLALLNKKNNGVILTSLYGHESCNTYIREIKDGVSEIHLLDEEQEALDKALNS